MGSGRFSEDDWKSYATAASHHTKTTHEIYSSALDSSLDPKTVSMRESRDSADNPRSTPIVLGLDVTGSMSSVLDVMARKGLPTLLTEIYDRKPVTDPHVMCMGIGDIEYDRAPLQVTQFEADIRIAEQLEKIWLESGGGGNSYESYALAWYFAAYHTSTDAYEKRGKKGYLFTIGDEEPTAYLRANDIGRFLMSKPQSDVNLEELLTFVSRKYEVFHIIVEEGSHARAKPAKVKNSWTELIGQRAISLSDHTKIAEVIVSTIQVVEGTDVSSVVGSWDGSTAVVVRKAVQDLITTSQHTGLVSL